MEERRRIVSAFLGKMFGSGRAILSLRESYRKDLEAVREYGFRVRALSRDFAG